MGWVLWVKRGVGDPLRSAGAALVLKNNPKLIVTPLSESRTVIRKLRGCGVESDPIAGSSAGHAVIGSQTVVSRTQTITT
jgi:hypothetical protein